MDAQKGFRIPVMIAALAIVAGSSLTARADLLPSSAQTATRSWRGEVSLRTSSMRTSEAEAVENDQVVMVDCAAQEMAEQMAASMLVMVLPPAVPPPPPVILPPPVLPPIDVPPQVDPQPTPEPATLLSGLIGTSIAGFVAWRRRKKTRDVA